MEYGPGKSSLPVEPCPVLGIVSYIDLECSPMPIPSVSPGRTEDIPPAPPGDGLRDVLERLPSPMHPHRSSAERLPLERNFLDILDRIHPHLRPVQPSIETLSTGDVPAFRERLASLLWPSQRPADTPPPGIDPLGYLARHPSRMGTYSPSMDNQALGDNILSNLQTDREIVGAESHPGSTLLLTGTNPSQGGPGIEDTPVPEGNPRTPGDLGMPGIPGGPDVPSGLGASAVPTGPAASAAPAAPGVQGSRGITELGRWVTNDLKVVHHTDLHILNIILEGVLLIHCNTPIFSTMHLIGLKFSLNEALPDVLRLAVQNVQIYGPIVRVTVFLPVNFASVADFRSRFMANLWRIMEIPVLELHQYGPMLPGLGFNIAAKPDDFNLAWSVRLIA